MRVPKPSAPAIALAAMFALGNFGPAVAAVYSLTLRSAFLTLYTFGIGWALSWWILADCRRRGLPVSIDHGWFAFSAWPVVLPYHLIRTRGAGRGCLVLAGMLGMFLATYLLGLAAFFLMT